MSNYKRISNFGNGAANAPSTNPIYYCSRQTIGKGFDHGGAVMGNNNAYGQKCQAFMSEYCAKKWDDICEFKSKDQNVSSPNLLGVPNTKAQHGQTLTSGEILIANTAARKYLLDLGSHCSVTQEPFDPTVASSPFINIWKTQSGCTPVYGVNPKEIDNDPVMQKILDKPIIAWSILVNIYNNAKRKDTLNDLKGTKLYTFFQSQSFQDYVNYV